MIFREGKISDIDDYMIVRMAVKENVFRNPALITRQDNIDYLTKYGKDWVCQIEDKIVGFVIVGLTQRNVWALFVQVTFHSLRHSYATDQTLTRKRGHKIDTGATWA